MKYLLNQDDVIVGFVEQGRVFLPDGYRVIQTNDPRTMDRYNVTEGATDEIDQIKSEFVAALKPYKIWKLVAGRHKPLADPTALNYKTGLIARLHPKHIFVKGELTNVEYYQDIVLGEYQDLIINVDIQYYRDESGQVTHRVTKRQWVDVDGNYGPHIKITEKGYDVKEASREGSRRRQNIVAGLLDNATQLGVISTVQTLFRSLDNEINAYEKTGDDNVIAKIAAYDGQWLDQQPEGLPATLRQMIIAELTLP